MKRLMVAFWGAWILFFAVSASAQTKVVVVPLGSSYEEGDAAGLDGQVQYNNGGKNAGAQIFYDKLTGNVGIGVTDPTYVLELTTEGNQHGIKSTRSYGIPIYAYRASSTGTWPAIHGTCESGFSNASAIRGYLENTNAGPGSAALRGVNKSIDGDGYGTFGSHDGSGSGVYGQSFSGYGVEGVGTQTTGVNYGGYFETKSTTGVGVKGFASNLNSGIKYGGSFIAYGNYGIGLYGGTATGNNGTGVKGVVSGNDGFGVYGRATSSSSVGVYGENSTIGAGVRGVSQGNAGAGVYGESTAQTGFGVRAKANSFDFYADNSGYGPFTGAHEVKLTEDGTNTILPGMIVSVTGEVELRKNRDNMPSLSSTLPVVQLSSEPNDKKVFGVFANKLILPVDHWYNATEEEKFGVVNALGEGRVLVTDINGNIEAGDYITSSSVPGFGQRQNDDFLHSYTLGKATETPDWDLITETVEYMGQEVKVYLIAVVYTSG